MKKPFQYSLLVIFACLIPEARASDTLTAKRYIHLKFGGTFNLGMGDMALRFPGFWGLNTGVFYQSQKKLTLGLHVSPLFGSVVTQNNVFGSIVGSTGSVIDRNGNPAVIRLYMRGISALATVGKIIPLSRKNPRSGIEIKAGIGFLKHKIRMQFDGDQVPQLDNDYLEGYDRLTNGLLFSQSVYYQYVNLQTVSFFAGVDFNQGLTTQKRSWVYSSKSREGGMRNDMYFGVSAGILIPISLHNRTEARYFD